VRSTSSLLFMLLFLLVMTAVPARAGELSVGAAAVSITPPPGTPMAGYYIARAATGVHDDLFAKAVVLGVDGDRAALVALDLISTTRDLVEAARREIERTTGLRGDAVMISATHAHTGPVLKGRGVREAAVGGDSDLSSRYSSGLPAKIAEAVRLAASRMAPAKARAGHGREASIAFNRRYHMLDGTVGWNPGKLNPKILKPAGTIDPDVPVVYFESAAGAPLATYVNYAVHLDNVGGLKFSADMPFTLGRSLAEYKGPEMVTLFTAGCCGDINHVDVSWREPQRGFENAARMGLILAAEVLRTWPKLEPLAPGALRVKSETISLALPAIAPGDVEKARAIAERARSGSKTDLPKFLDQVWAYKVLDVSAREGRPQEVEVQVVALGDDLAWVSLPGEIFVELGLAIKQDSPFKHTIIAELANGAIGYIPSRRAYAQGNYEVVSARCAEGSGERLVDAAVRILKGLHVSGQGRPDAEKRP
jgi:neutral ceramidase